MGARDKSRELPGNRRQHAFLRELKRVGTPSAGCRDARVSYFDDERLRRACARRNCPSANALKNPSLPSTPCGTSGGTSWKERLGEQARPTDPAGLVGPAALTGASAAPSHSLKRDRPLAPVRLPPTKRRNHRRPSNPVTLASGPRLEPECYTRLSSVRLLNEAPMPPPCQGLRVIDLTRSFTGALATMVLADAGAEVVKASRRRAIPAASTTRPHVAPRQAAASS